MSPATILNRMEKNKGFSLIEVLVGIVMLSLAVMTMSGALRQLYQWKYKQAAYENLYETVDSLLDLVTGTLVLADVEAVDKGEGTLNGLGYSYRCQPLTVTSNYNYSDDPSQSGNNGFFRVALQECSLTLKGDQLDRSFTFYRTVYCCPSEERDNPQRKKPI